MELVLWRRIHKKETGNQLSGAGADSHFCAGNLFLLCFQQEPYASDQVYYGKQHRFHFL